MGLQLKSQVDVAIRAHGAETYPNECCGALIGRAGIVTQTLALPNMTDEGPRRRFLVTPNDYREAERRAEDATRFRRTTEAVRGHATDDGTP